jgi:hypothetical protein
MAQAHAAFRTDRADSQRRWSFRAVKETSLKKPAKTREELESAIRTEMEDICEWPTGLAISVVPHEDSWKVVIMTDGATRSGAT